MGEEGRLNQDALLAFQISPKKIVLAISDGMGGHAKGELASAIILNSLMETLLAQKKESEIDYSLREAILASIELSHAKIKETKTGAGATVVIAEVSEGTVRFYNVGDSLGAVYGGRGRLKYKTLEHSVAGHGVEAGLLKEREARNHVEGHLLLNVVGLEDIRIDVSSEISIHPLDQILLCSDGLSASVYPQDIEEILGSGRLDKRLSRLRERALKNQSAKPELADDLTAILFR